MTTPARLLAVVALSTGALALPLSAQSAQCASQPAALRDACQKGTDIFAMLMPQVQGALGGGGPVLGSSRAVRGLSIGLRVNAMDGAVPEITNVSLSGTGVVRSTFATKRAPVPMPALDVALGVFPGVNLGVQRVLSLDALVNVAYMPKQDVEDFSIRPSKSSFKFGYGARLGLLADRLMVPAVAISYFRRQIPTTTFSTSFTSGVSGVTVNDSLALSELSIRNDALRLSASKKLGFIEIGGGVGQDTYRSFSQLQARVTPPVGSAASGAFVLTQQIKRNAAYGSLALNILKLRIGAEAGQTFGGDSVSTFNEFTDGKINEKRMFGSVGLRLSF
ncbi:MAG: hypothetical protein IT355_07275 [Gemmatimonadaceae bacterium]|nr:hypothetical protein [Gemmatimonadaceae bacterium]